MHDIAVIIATHQRERLLLERSFASVLAQSLQPKRLIIVNDGDPLSTSTLTALRAPSHSFEFEVLGNQRRKGYAGTLNSGLIRLHEIGFEGFVAVLDDDDTWDVEHLALNQSTAHRDLADAVVSGLRLIKDGEIRPRDVIRALKPEDFYCGNPGWQGSNTFVRLHSLLAAGGFREGLVSCNDRDLAIRLLRLPGFRVAFTGQWTASWYLEKNRAALSHGRSDAKLAGLRGFWRLHRAEMAPEQQARFITHASTRFGFDREAVTVDDGPPLDLLPLP